MVCKRLCNRLERAGMGSIKPLKKSLTEKLKLCMEKMKTEEYND